MLLTGKRVTLMGLGRHGGGLARLDTWSNKVRG